jgi:SAM-dependent methyltransferase
VSFNVSGDAYALFMGRFSEPLADRFVELVPVEPGDRVLDVGCGPGVLTQRLVDRLGADAVQGVDPSGSFLEAARERLPQVQFRLGDAEELDYPDDAFDAAFAQLVVHFMTDAVRGLRQMARVTAPGGVVAACVWDHEGGAGPLSTFWDAVHEVDPAAPDEGHLPGTRQGHLAELMRAAGLTEVWDEHLDIAVPFASFDAWWQPFLLGVGPAGAYLARQPESRIRMVADACAARFPEGPFETSARAWTALARVS